MACIVVIFAGQSNMEGPDSDDAPSGLPDATIRFWKNNFSYDDGPHAFIDLNVDTQHNNWYSHEIMTARTIQSAGIDKVAVIKLVQGATFINTWIPGAAPGHPGSKFYVELAEAWADLPAEFPGETQFIPFFVWDQGETEARYDSLPTVQAWGENHALIVAGVVAVVGQLGGYYVVRTCSTIADKTFPGVLEGEQEGAVVDSRHWFDTNDLLFLPDNVHRTGVSQNLLGATRVGPQIIEDIWNMSLSHGTPTRTAVADTVVDRVDAGAGAGKIVIRQSTTVLCTVNNADPAYGAAANGVATLLGVPLTGTAGASGVADNFLEQDSDSNTVFAGSVTATGGEGDLTLDSVNITINDIVTITGGSYTAPP